MRNFRLRIRSGFTMIELLVVISIIAILVALTAVSYTTAQQRARDARRRGDIKNMSSLMEQYYSLNQGYPANCDASFGWLSSPAPTALPTDPQGNAYTVKCTTTTYCFCAKLDGTDGNSTVSAPATGVCAFTSPPSSTTKYYCLGNQQ